MTTQSVEVRIFLLDLIGADHIVGNPLPRAPTPPTPVAHDPDVDDWDARSEHREHSSSEDQRHGVGRKDARAAQGSRQSQRARSTSTTRSGHNGNRRAEPFQTPSPPRSRDARGHPTVTSEGSAISGMTERERTAERMAELGARHVTFRDTPSERSATAWPSFESSPTKHEKFEEGWDNGDSRGNGSQW